MKTVEITVRINVDVPEHVPTDKIFVQLDSVSIGYFKNPTLPITFPSTINEYETVNVEDVYDA